MSRVIARGRGLEGMEVEGRTGRTVDLPARIWKTPVRRKRPPFCRVKSWQKKRMREMQLKMMDRIMTAWTAWIHSVEGERDRDTERERERDRATERQRDRERERERERGGDQ